ncbi:MAG TPA: glucuronate isomerase [Chitinophagaceae bacterium]|nr:glucuronate isomerase [Chitinophagaceae bacterium]
MSTSFRHAGTGGDKPFFLHDDFLLQSEQARRLYHDYARHLPIIDYHNHLPPREIAENKRFANMTQIWLRGDHYKWRAMRALGMPERVITGDADDEEKFFSWAEALPRLVRNPLFHWSHLELYNTFGIKAYLNQASAGSIYATCNAQLATPGHSTRELLEGFRVEVVGTTDDPCDHLEFHQRYASQPAAFRLVPSFRPDKLLVPGSAGDFRDYIQRLEQTAGSRITDMASLLSALKTRMDYFHEVGCRVSDHGLPQIPYPAPWSSSLDRSFASFLRGQSPLEPSWFVPFAGHLLVNLCEMYYQKGWVQQFHLGAMRNLNPRLLARLGADAGADSMGDSGQAEGLARLLGTLAEKDALAKTILYNLHPALNEVFATMAGNFNDESGPGKIQFGSGWWFLDQKDGMEKQLNTLSYLGVISTFIGMTTDSRSFLSFSRHEYFRRVLCNLFGHDMATGLIPNDASWIGEIIQRICYFNAKQYFGFPDRINQAE